ncbi:hypothetical protein G443_002608 [Actinoalloteichus cyanogriseus DSM 43889]|uniref:Basic proline-rich protein n=1 Tax=Actinoalloteichus caeruleus DSM 43889 TaxID=1120930 RepID=A0ABT1JJI4_ACTCY|nr:hypothetical protein [Actinoalloteichus caeruleus DSM 43889]
MTWWNRAPEPPPTAAERHHHRRPTVPATAVPRRAPEPPRLPADRGQDGPPDRGNRPWAHGEGDRRVRPPTGGPGTRPPERDPCPRWTSGQPTGGRGAGAPRAAGTSGATIDRHRPASSSAPPPEGAPAWVTSRRTAPTTQVRGARTSQARSRRDTPTSGDRHVSGSGPEPRFHRSPQPSPARRPGVLVGSHGEPRGHGWRTPARRGTRNDQPNQAGTRLPRPPRRSAWRVGVLDRGERPVDPLPRALQMTFADPGQRLPALPQLQRPL